MRKLSKSIALLALLAIVLSLFATFSVFAEEKAANAAAEGGTVIYDIDKKAPSISNDPEDNQVIMTTNVSANGIPYYVFKYENGWSKENKYHNAGGQTTFLQFQPSSTPYFSDGYNSSAKPVADTIDYLVIDMDISTVTDPFESHYLQTLFYYRTEAGGRTSGQNAAWTLRDPLSEGTYFICPDNKGKNPENVFVNQEASLWAHVTMVVDASKPTNRTAYLYYNGQFIDSRKCMADTADYLESIRIQLGDETLYPSADNESLAMANFTIKSFPNGYNGDFAANKDRLGNTSYTLADFEDLKYCLEDVPVRGVADIERDGKLIGAMTAEDLNCKVKPGDKVTLYQNIEESVILPGKLDGETLVPGFDLVDNGFAITNPKYIENYGTYDWLIIDAEGTITGGKQTYKNNAAPSASVTVSTDALYNALKANYDGRTIVLLKDMATCFISSIQVDSGSVVFDLNGHTWYDTYAGNSWRIYGKSGGVTGGKITIKNGSLASNGNIIKSEPFAENAEINLIKLENASFAKPIIHTRGVMNVIDCPNITATGDFILQMSQSANETKVNIENSSITSAGGSLATMESLERGGSNQFYASGGKRCGGANLTLNMENSSFVTTGSEVLDVNIYANKYGTTSSFRKATNVTINLNGSTITSAGTAISYDVHTLNAKGSGLEYETSPKNFRDDITITITDTDVTAKQLVYVSDSIAYAAATDTSTFVNRPIAANVTVTGGGLHLADTAVVRNSENAILTFAANIANGVKTDVATLATGGATLTNEGAIAAYTSDEEYTYVVTNSYRTLKYEVQGFKGKGGTRSGEFTWNGADNGVDPVNVDKVFARPANSEYKYTDWLLDGDTYACQLAPNFSLSANLTALTDFYLNVYLSAGVDTEKFTMTIGDETVTTFDPVRINGKDYLKVAAIKDITPDKVNSASEVEIQLANPGPLGEEALKLEASVSVESYLVNANAKKNTLSENGAAFVQAIINYVVAACNYDGEAPASLAALATEITTPEYTGASFTGPDGVKAAINLGSSVRWEFTGLKNGETYTFEYAGVSRKFTADESGKIIIGMRAVDLLGDIKITDSTGDTGTVNLAGYYKELEGNTKAQTVVNALYHYSVAASAYATEHKEG